MGSLKLRITLNHHNSQRPLYSTSNKIPTQEHAPIGQETVKSTLIDRSIGISTATRLGTLTRQQSKQQRCILGLDFVELILKNRKEQVKQVSDMVQRFYLKFRLFNRNHQTKFLGAQARESLVPLDILLAKLNLQKFGIGKTVFVELDLGAQGEIESAFGKPMEIQLWHKIESSRSYERPVKEEMLG
mmetsp:Transcript_34710/g.53248  ORF Transcript_34710/g.53248 Transcript_34710/m.53248 type:complete len:187 (+) Transcript_34710:5623-6183(+)